MCRCSVVTNLTICTVPKLLLMQYDDLKDVNLSILIVSLLPIFGSRSKTLRDVCGKALELMFWS